jgi:hypothetical protein
VVVVNVGKNVGVNTAKGRLPGVSGAGEWRKPLKKVGSLSEIVWV